MVYINVCGRRMSGQNNMAALSIFLFCQIVGWSWVDREFRRDWCCPLNCDHSNIEKARKRLFLVEDWFTFIPVMWVEFLLWIRSINRPFPILCSSAFNQLYHTSLYVWVTRDDRVHLRFRRTHTTLIYSAVSSSGHGNHVKQQKISL